MNVFITGASSGIGAALAREFAARGAMLGLVARSADALATLAAGLPGHHRVYPLDVTDRVSVIGAARDFDAAGGADIVIANAGISVGVCTEYVEDLAEFDKAFATNVLALASTLHPFIAPMRSRGRGTLVVIASVAGVRGLPGSEAYCASKAAAMRYAESLRVGLRGSGVKVVTILPGFVRTPMTVDNPYPMPFLMPAEDFARAAVRAILAGKSSKVIPWPMAWVAAALKLMPDAIFDRLMAGRSRKPRRVERESPATKQP